MRAWLIVMGAACLWGCAEDDLRPVNPVGGSGGGAAGEGGTAGEGAAGGGVGGEGGDEPVTRTGFASVLSGPYDDSVIPDDSYAAAFFDVFIGTTGNECSESQIGACETRVCLGTGNDDNVQEINSQAGVITISGGSVQSLVTLTPDTDAQYRHDLDTGDLVFSGGETLTFSASGGDAPAFQQTVVAPTFITVTQPDMSAALVAPLADDLELTWTGGTAGEVIVSLVRALGPGASRRATCTFGASAGTGSVPAAALAVIGAGDTDLSVRVASEVELRLDGGWQVRVTAYSSGGIPGGSGGETASTTLALQ